MRGTLACGLQVVHDHTAQNHVRHVVWWVFVCVCVRACVCVCACVFVCGGDAHVFRLMHSPV